MIVSANHSSDPPQELKLQQSRLAAALWNLQIWVAGALQGVVGKRKWWTGEMVVDLVDLLLMFHESISFADFLLLNWWFDDSLMAERWLFDGSMMVYLW